MAGIGNKDLSIRFKKLVILHIAGTLVGGTALELRKQFAGILAENVDQYAFDLVVGKMASITDGYALLLAELTGGDGGSSVGESRSSAGRPSHASIARASASGNASGTPSTASKTSQASGTVGRSSGRTPRSSGPGDRPLNSHSSVSG